MDYLVVGGKEFKDWRRRRAERAGTAGEGGVAAGAAGSASASAAEIQIERRDLSPRDADDLELDPNVGGVLPNFPTMLPETVNSKDDIGMDQRSDLGDSKMRQVTWGISEIGAAASSLTGKGVKVAILDTGINENHPTFSGAIVGKKDFTKSGGIDDTHGTNGHGTHCAGTALGRPVEGIRIGVAPQASALIAKVIGNGAGAIALIEGIRWALEGEQGANIVSMSLGFDFRQREQDLAKAGLHPNAAFGRALKEYTQCLELFESFLAFEEARLGDSFPLFVCATGNSSRRLGRNGVAPYWVPAHAPAAVERILRVGAAQRAENNLALAPFSNSDAIVVGPGVRVVSASRSGGLVEMDGTSMACPHVAGLAALWWEHESNQNGAASAEAVKARIIVNAKRGRFINHTDIGRGLAMAPP
jgi:subtilisin family serine protease